MPDRDRSGSLSRDRRKARQVGRDGCPIGVAEVGGGVLDAPGHGPAGHVAVGVAAGPEAGLQVIGHIARAPPAEPVLGVRRDVGHLLAVRSVQVPGQLARPVPGAEQVARRVAFTAVAQVLVKHHGEDAAIEAAIRADAMLEKGDLACPECRFLAATRRHSSVPFA